MNKRAFTLLEVVIATVLGMLVMLGSVITIEVMQRQVAGVQSTMTNDMDWIEANRHLVQMVRNSSYIEIPDANTLILRNYDGTEHGRYVNNSAQGRIEYYVNDGAILDSTFPSTQPQGQNRHVNATFTYPAAPKGIKNGRYIETIIDYTVPFTSTLSLTCKATTRSSSTWAVLIIPPTVAQVGATYTYYPESVLRTSDNSYLITGAVGIFPSSTSKAYLIKLSSQGNKLWSRMYQGSAAGTPLGNSSFWSAMQNPSGKYTVAGQTYPAPNPAGGVEVGHLLVTIIPNSGDVDSDKLYHLSPFGAISYTFDDTAHSIFNQVSNVQNGAFTGYCIADKENAPPANWGATLWQIDTAGNVSGAARLYFIKNGAAYCNVVPNCITQVFDIHGQPDGFLIVGTTTLVIGFSTFKDIVFIIRVDTGGNVTNAIAYKTLRWRTTWSVNQVFKNNKADGFMVAISPAGIILRLNQDLSQKWLVDYSYQMPTGGAVAGIPPAVIQQTSDGNFILTTAQTLYKIDDDGNMLWQQPACSSLVGGYMDVHETFDPITKQPDGYIALAMSGIGVSTNPIGGGTYGFFNIMVLKTDINGDCPEAAYPTLIADNPSTTVFNTVDTPVATDSNTEVDIDQSSIVIRN